MTNKEPDIASETAATPMSSTSAREPIIEARKLSKSFRTTDGELKVLQDLNLSVRPGEMVAIVGESGVGKSTLLHLLGGLDKPSRGEIVCQGQLISSLSEDQRSLFRNANIGFVFQFHHLLDDFTALENVAMPALVAGKTRSEAFAEAERLLAMMGLTERKSHCPGELSGGEQQRVAVARAIINEPALLLADEPTGNLDVKTGFRLHETLLEINRRRQGAFIIATHNNELAKRCDRVYRLESGVLSLES